MMAAGELATYRQALTGCRFCPMCKPAGEVFNLTLLESHSTRARAMHLWRVLEGMAPWGSREVELLYQSTLDSISEAWCVSHYPVSGYVAGARAMVFEAGLAPQAVRDALQRPIPVSSAEIGDTLLLACEAAELGDGAVLTPTLQVLQRAGVGAHPVMAPSGALAYCLGDRDRAREQARQVVDLIRESRARIVIADGPQTLWALRRVFPAVDVPLPAGVEIVSLSARLAGAAADGRLNPPRRAGTKVLVHDSRSATLIAEKMAAAETIQPGYRGPEEKLGEGEVFEASRRLVDATGASRLFTVWSRSLCRSCGADDGLWLTYPALAEGMARQRLQEARALVLRSSSPTRSCAPDT